MPSPSTRREVRIRKFILQPVLDVLEDGQVVGEWTGESFVVFAGHKSFPVPLAKLVIDSVDMKKVDELRTE